MRALSLEASLLYRFSVMSNRAAARLQAFYSVRYGLTVPGWRVIAHLGEHQPMNGRDIAERAAMDSVSVTRALNHLDKLGMVDRKIDVEDRRRVLVRLTRKGQGVYDTVAPMAVREEAELIASLSAAERAVLYELTRRIWENPPKA